MVRPEWVPIQSFSKAGIVVTDSRNGCPDKIITLASPIQKSDHYLVILITTAANGWSNTLARLKVLCRARITICLDTAQVARPLWGIWSEMAPRQVHPQKALISTLLDTPRRHQSSFKRALGPTGWDQLSIISLAHWQNFGSLFSITSFGLKSPFVSWEYEALLPSLRFGCIVSAKGHGRDELSR